jgi:hypothetical protein
MLAERHVYALMMRAATRTERALIVRRRWPLGEIYCLYSPREGIPRYVGKTEHSSHLRWQQHIAKTLRQQPGLVNEWIQSLFEGGMDPAYHVLQENVIPADLDMFESYWIQQFADLLNQRGVTEPVEQHTMLGLQVISVIKGKIAAREAL